MAARAPALTETIASVAWIVIMCSIFPHAPEALRIEQIGRIVVHVREKVPALRITCILSNAVGGIGGHKAAEAIDVVAGGGEVVAGFVVAGIGGEELLGALARLIPGFAEGEVALLGERVAAGVGEQARGEMVVVVVEGCRAVYFRHALSQAVNILPRWGDHATLILGKDPTLINRAWGTRPLGKSRAGGVGHAAIRTVREPAKP